MKRFFTPRSIGQRFAMAIGTGAGALLVVLAMANYFSGRELLLEQTSSEALKEVHDEMRSMDDLMDRLAIYPTVIATTQIAEADKGGVTVPWLASLLKSCPIPAVYAFYMRLDNSDWRKPGRGVNRKDYPKPIQLKYDFHDPSQDWYGGARDSGKLHISKPYFDRGGSDIEMISITKPVYNGDGIFIGVAGIDVALDEMQRIVRSMHIRDFGVEFTPEGGRVTSISKSPSQTANNLRESAYLIDSNGSLIIGPSGSKQPPDLNDRGEKISSDSMNLKSRGLLADSDAIARILSDPNGWMRLKGNGDKVIYWAEGKVTGWKLVLEVPYEFIVSPAHTLAKESALIGGVGLLLLMGVSFFVARRISEPITELRSVAAAFEKGSYEEGKGVLDEIEKRPDELGRFASSFSAMTREIRLREERLSLWNVNLEKAISDRTADLAEAMGRVEKVNRTMEGELAQAATYSRAVLPRKMEGRVKTDWVFETSTQLGGDSFGYHWLDDFHLSIYLLDVCGHGVGAALLSTSVVSVLRTASLAGTDFHDPGVVLKNLNTAFPMEQHNNMFFTAWYGVYSILVEEIRFACGGHPPAILLRPDGGAGQLAAKGPVVGAFPNAEYETAVASIPPGSRLYLFSDGVYEIDRPGREMMTYDEFSRLLTEAQSVNLNQVLAEIRSQHGSDLLADDFSLLSFEFMPQEQPAQDSSLLVLTNSPEALHRLTEFAQKFASSHAFAPEDCHDLEVILEEVVTNVIKYGEIEPGAEACRIDLCVQGNLLLIALADRGIPFDPLGLPPVDTHRPIEERSIGGLGIHFIKKLTVSQHYEYRDGQNILTLAKSLGRLA